MLHGYRELILIIRRNVTIVLLFLILGTVLVLCSLLCRGVLHVYLYTFECLLQRWGKIWNYQNSFSLSILFVHFRKIQNTNGFLSVFKINLCISFLFEMKIIIISEKGFGAPNCFSIYLLNAARMESCPVCSDRDSYLNSSAVLRNLSISLESIE